MNFFRVIKTSIKNFFRNLWLSLATFSMMVLALSLIGALILLNASANVFGDWLEDKVDVSVFFEETASEEDILEFKELIEDHSDVASVVYQPKEEELEKQKKLAEETDNKIILTAIDLVESNPFQASLRISATNIGAFGAIEKYISGLPNADTLVDTIGHNKKEELREKITEITTNVSYAVLIFIIALSIFVFLVTYNTIRLSIYTSRDEIHIMKLVGASNWFVRGPFIITGFFYGLFSSLITIAIMIIATHQAGQHFKLFRVELNLYGYLLENIIYIYGALFLLGLFMGVVSSYIAVRRYLRV